MKPDSSPAELDHPLESRALGASAFEAVDPRASEAAMLEGAAANSAAQHGRAAVLASLEAVAAEDLTSEQDGRALGQSASNAAPLAEPLLAARHERRRVLSEALEPNVPPANDDLAAIGAAFKAVGARSRFSTAVGVAVATFVWLATLGALYAVSGMSPAPLSIAVVGLTGIYAIILLAIFIVARMAEAQATTRSLVRIVASLSNPEAVDTGAAGAMSQAVKNEIAAIDASLDQTFARAANLETVLRAEYRDFERAFTEREQQFQRFLESMSSERASIVTNAEKVRSAMSGAHQNLSRDLDEASQRFSRLVVEASAGLANTIDQKSADMAKAAAAASDRCAARLDSSLEGSIIRASDLVEGRGDKFAALLANKGNELDEKLSARMKDASDLFERQIKDAQDKAAFRLDAMASQIDKLLKKMDKGIGERGEAINAMLATRTIDIARTLKDTGNEFRQTLDRTNAVTTEFSAKAQTLNSQLSQQIGRLNDAIVVPLGMAAASIDEKGRLLSMNLTDRFTKIDNMLTGQSNRLDALLGHEIEALRVTLDGSIEAVKAALGGGSANLKTSLADRAQKIEAVLSERLSAFSSLISENRTRLAFELSTHTQSLDQMLDRQRALLTDLSDQRPGGTSQALRIGSERRPTAEVQLPPASIAREIYARSESSRSTILPSTPPQGALPPRSATATGPLRERLNAIDSAQAALRPRETSAAPARERSYASILPTSLPTAAPAPRPAVTTASVARPTSLPSSASTSAYPAHAAAEPPVAPSNPARSIAGAVPEDGVTKTWLSDLLARASIDEEGAAEIVADKPNYQDAPISSIAANVGNFVKSDELQAAWERYNSGSVGDFQSIYTPKGAVMHLKIKQRLVEDGELRQAVNSYVTEFERLLQEVHQDSGEDLIFEYLHTDAGKVYTMLAHASNRLGGVG